MNLWKASRKGARPRSKYSAAGWARTRHRAARGAFVLLLAIFVTLLRASAPSAAEAPSNPFSVAGIDDPNEVRSFLATFQDALRRGDRAAVVRLVPFPRMAIFSRGALILKSRQELLDNFDAIFDPYLTRVILETKYEDLWANWRGVFIGGRGVIIFGHVFHGRLMDYDAEQDEAKRRRYWKMGIQVINGGEAAREELFLSHTPHDVRLFDLERGVYETEQYLFRFIAPEGVTACVLSPPGIPAFGPVYIPLDRATPCTSLKDETSVVWVAADFSKKERASFRTNASYFCRPQPDRSGPSAIVSARLSNSDIRLGGRLPVAICRFEYGDGKVSQIAMARRQVPGWEDFQINYTVSADLQPGSHANADELQRSALRSFQLLPDPVPRRTQK